MSDDEVTIKLDELKMIFDMVVSSLDFGSGFLETDDVELLRRIAVMIGVDPVEATPRMFAAQYPHPWQRPDSTTWPAWAGECAHCGRTDDDPIHTDGS